MPPASSPTAPACTAPPRPSTELEKVLCPKDDGGVLSRKGVVDYSIGKGVAPGVFVIAEMAHPRVRERMHDLKLGPGPYYTFYRPYHLTSLEVPLSCARAVLYQAGRHAAAATCRSAEVCAVAKKDLAARREARRHRRIHLSRLDHDRVTDAHARQCRSLRPARRTAR